MPQEPPPTKPRKPTLAYVLAAAAIWTLVAYDLIVHTPPRPAWALAAAGPGCAR